MRIKKLLAFVFFVILIFSCSGVILPFIKLEGTWTAAGPIDDEHTWYLEYKFTGNKYQLQGYPPLSESGTMHLKETKGDSLFIEFRVIKSNPEYENHSEWIYLKGDEFILNSHTFRRSIDEKKQLK